MPDVTVLYEDRRGPTNEFGLHNLVTACVADVLGGTQWHWARTIECRPVKGSGNLVQDCHADAVDIAWEGRRVIAVFDSDRIRELLGLRGDTDEAELRHAIDAALSPTEHFRVFLLERNQESVLEAAIGCGLRASVTERERAIVRKKPGVRDKLMMRAAAGAKDVRDCILRTIPSLAAVVRHLVEAVAKPVSGSVDGTPMQETEAGSDIDVDA